MLRRLFLLSFIWLYGVFAFSQEPLSVDYSIHDGLPHNGVYCFEEDTAGQVWAGTEHGVCRFSSYGIHSYISPPGLNSNDVTAIYRDRKGTLWFDCFGNWPSYWDGEGFVDSKADLPFTGSVLQTNQFFFQQWKKEAYVVFSITKDKKCIYNLTSGEYRFVYGGLSVLNFIYELGGVTHYIISERIFIDNGSPNLFYTGRMLDLRIDGLYAFTIVQRYNENELFGVGADGSIFTIRITKSGLAPARMTITLPNFRRVITTRNGEYYLSSDAVYKRKKQSFHLEYQTNVEIRTAFEDSQGNLWIGTAHRGVFLRRNDAPILLNKLQSDLSYRQIWRHGGKIHVTTNIEHLTLDQSGWKRKKLPTLQGNLYDQGDEEPHEGTTSHKVVVFPSGEIQVLDLDGIGTLKSIKKETESAAIVGSFYCFARYDLRNKKVLKYLWMRRARMVRQYDDSTFLLLGLDTLTIYRTSTDKVIDKWPVSGIRDITITDGVVILLKGDGSLILRDIYSGRSKVSKPLTNAKNSLSMPYIVNRIRSSSDGALMVATNKGWFYFQVDSKTLELRLKYELLSQGERWSRSVKDICLKDSEVFYITDQALFRHTLSSENRLIRKAICESIRGKDEVFARSTYGSIPRKKNDLSILVDFVTTNHATNIPFDYKLIGLSENWIGGVSNELTFSNLAPGSYELLVRPVVSSSPSNETFSVVKFTVQPFFYETGPFRLLMILSLILIIVLITALVLRARNKNQKVALEHNQLVSQMELRNMRASMNPHFIFNSLNSIQYYYVKHDLQSANHYLSRFADLIRKILNVSLDTTVPLEREVDLLQNYLELEKMRLKEKLDYNLKVDPDLLEMNLRIPQMLIQPYIENSIQHGLINGGYVDVEIKSEDGQLIFIIDDDGIGIEESKKQNKINYQPLGTQITRNRLDLLKKHYKSDFEVTVIDKTAQGSDATGTTVTVILPLDQL